MYVYFSSLFFFDVHFPPESIDHFAAKSVLLDLRNIQILLKNWKSPIFLNELYGAGGILFNSRQVLAWLYY